MLTAKTLLNKAADLMEEYGTSDGQFIEWGQKYAEDPTSQRMCIHGALNIAQAMLLDSKYVYPNDVPIVVAESFGDFTAHMDEAILAVALSENIVIRENDPWIASWSNDLARNGEGDKIPVILRKVADTFAE